ncbi:MAG: multiprotein bridging factor aMBF1 [Halobacteria archaeon]|nr:multiprotein bridging factor aMBF1 [Halobacteria archaeon]
MQCEMCGDEAESLTVVQTEGTKLKVCSNCEEFGTVLEDETRKQRSTETGGSGSGSSSSESSGTTSRSKSTSKSRSDVLDDIETLAADYDERVREARESEGLTQEELGKKLNEKASLIRKIERGEMRPDEDVREELERALGVSLTEEVSGKEEVARRDTLSAT